MISELTLKPKMLTLEDLTFLRDLGRVEESTFVLERSSKGYKLKTPTTVLLDKVLALGQRGLAEYIISSLLSQRPRLIPWVLENSSLVELARYLLRARSGSLMSFYVYTNTISQYSRYLNASPDSIIGDLKPNGLQSDVAKVEKHRKFLEDCLAGLQDRHLSPGRIHAYAKHVRTFYRVNGINIPVPYLPSPRLVHKDRAPKPEELQRLLDTADLRERVIVSMFALGGFREGTLVRLQYRHVREDLERGIVPLHIHVEPEITKGKYHDYDTFIGREAVEFLKQYLDTRRKGLIDRRITREDIHDDSPLIRDHQTKIARPIGEKQLYKLVHTLYSQVGLLKQNNSGGYDLRVHSLRKYFKTQMMALGVQPDYIDYMMGHTVDTYHDIQSKGIEFLRNIYATAGLSIAPKQKGWELDALKAFARGLGLEPEKVLTQAAFAEPHRVYITAEDHEQAQTKALSMAIKELIKKELLSSEKFPDLTLTEGCKDR